MWWNVRYQCFLSHTEEESAENKLLDYLSYGTDITWHITGEVCKASDLLVKLLDQFHHADLLLAS